MKIGTITCNGLTIGTVDMVTGDANDTFVADMRYNPSGRAEGGDTGKSFHHHGVGHSRPSHESEPGHRHGPGQSHEIGDIPYSSSAGNPFDRSRFVREIEAKPGLADKMAHISLGENQDPRANLAVVETMMNRAVVRGTSLATQVRRHRSSGVDENGYYAGWAQNYSAEKKTMFDRNLGEALGTSGKGQSNVTNYATDNSSGSLAAREKASGAFKHHTTINGESFFSPGHAEPALAERWRRLNNQAIEHEAHPDPVTTEGLVNKPVGPQS